MQRLEVLYRGNLVTGYPPPLVDTAHYFALSVKSVDDEQYLEVVAHDDGGDLTGEHLVPMSLVRSASARTIQPAEEASDVQQ